MKIKISLPLFLLTAVIFFSSCDYKRITDDYRTIPHGKWEKDSIQTFTFNILNRRQNHNIYFNVRNDQTYPYSNLWLFVTLSKQGGEARRDTIQLMLAESSGKWLGKGFSGTYSNRLIYLRNFIIPEPGQYILSLQHGMRPEILEGITAIGIRVEKVY